MYVSNEDSGDISVIDTSSNRVVGSIRVGKRPRGMRVSPDGKTLYVALSGSPKAPPGVDESKLPAPDRSADGIGVIDLRTHRLVRTLRSGQDPESFDVSRDGKTLYVSNEETAQVSVVDVASGDVVRTVDVGHEPEGVTIRPDGRVVYVACEESNAVDVIDVASNRVVASIPTPQRPRTIVFTSGGRRAFVSAEFGSAVVAVDPQTHRAIAEIPIPATGAAAAGPKPMGLALSRDDTQLFVTNGRGGTVTVIDVATNQVTRTIPSVGARPWGIDITPRGDKLYTANGPSNDVSVLDAVSGTVLARVRVGRSPWGVVVSR